MLGPHSEPCSTTLRCSRPTRELCVEGLRTGPTCRAKTQYKCRRPKLPLKPRQPSLLKPIVRAAAGGSVEAFLTGNYYTGAGGGSTAPSSRPSPMPRGTPPEGTVSESAALPWPPAIPLSANITAERRSADCRPRRPSPRMIRRDGYNLLSDGNTSRPTRSDGERIEPPSSSSSDPQQFRTQPAPANARTEQAR